MFRLAKGVFACASEEGAIVLDSRHDSYLGFDPEQERALGALVIDWPRTTAAIANDAAVRFAHALTKRGVLELDDGMDREIATASPPAATEALHRWEDMSAQDVRVRDVWTFSVACVVAGWYCRHGKIAAAIQRIRSRKSQCARAYFDVSAAQIALSRYYHIRAFFFSKRGRCLFDSLTLLEFLARERLYPCWIIGVQIQPFAAHSWIQHGRFVLNGTPEFVRAYTPILAV